MTVIEQWTGAHATALRHAMRLSKEGFAEELGVSARAVAKWSAQPDLTPYPQFQQMLDTLLERLDDSARQRFSMLVSPPEPPKTEADVWGRETPPPLNVAAQKSLHGFRLDTPLSLDDVLSARAEIPKIVALDNRFGAADIVKVATRLFRSLQDRPNGLGTESNELYATLAELAELAGWLAYDAELHPLARRMNQEAVHYARMCGDRSVELLALQNMSMHASVMGRPNESIAIVSAVLDQKLSPRVRALFLTRQARAQAQLGDASAIRMFENIRSLFLDGPVDSDLQHFWWIDEREMAWHEAMAASDLGHHRRGMVSFERSVEATPTQEVRSQYLHRAYLLRAQIEQQAWSEVALTVASLQPLAIEVASTRTDKLIQQLAARPATAPEGVADSLADLVLLTEQKSTVEGILA